MFNKLLIVAEARVFIFYVVFLILFLTFLRSHTEGAGRTDFIRTEFNHFHNMQQPEKDLSWKRWESSKACSQRIVSCCATWWMLWDAWPKWCWENFFYQHGKNIVFLCLQYMYVTWNVFVNLCITLRWS